MTKEAILHIPLSQYAFAINEETIVVRLRTAKNDAEECKLYYGDRVCVKPVVEVTEMTMEKVASDSLFDYYETEITDRYSRICYYFRISCEDDATYYYSQGFSSVMQCDRTEYFQFPYIHRENIPDIPAWAEDVVMYHIFPDSFATGPRGLRQKPKEIPVADGMVSRCRLGGTLKGIEANLDYVADMGFNCIYLNPIFTAGSYHKYDTIDYFTVDPCFGTNEDLIRFVDVCHEKGIRVILDGVFNHCGADFFAFQDVLQKGEASRYYSWFYKLGNPVRYKDPPNYEAFAYVKEMPKLDTGNPEVLAYFCEVGRYWIETAGIDGWRLDVANEIDHNFWRAFRRSVREVKRDAFLIGEIWEESGSWLMGDQLDSTMNYTFAYLCRAFFGEGRMSVREFDEKIQGMLMRYSRQASLVQMNFLDTHDVPRFMEYCGGDVRKLGLAMFYLLMSAGIPSVFYGDELLVRGKEEGEYRKAMPWEMLSGPSFVNELKRWIALRKNHKCLRKGNYRTVWIDEEKRIYAFSRTFNRETMVIVINNSEKEVCADLTRMLGKAKINNSEEEIDNNNSECIIGAYGGKIFAGKGEKCVKMAGRLKDNYVQHP